MAITVSTLARHAGVSVRTLHHYDDVGLLRPSDRSEAGYRLYTDDDLLKLQQILFFRALGFPLQEIARILADPSFRTREALEQQRAVLIGKKARIEEMISAVETSLDHLEKGTPMKPDTMFTAFDPTEYDEEARQRWGDSAAWKESARRTSGYTQRDWEEMKQGWDALYRRLGALLAEGRPASDAEVQTAVEAHRLHIDRWFYPCSREMHAVLGQGYVTDPRFQRNIDRYGAGLSQLLADATRFAAETA